MITAIEGVTGSGKSRYAVGCVCESLLAGRFVVTNLPLDLPEIRFWFETERPEVLEKYGDMVSRIRILKESEYEELYRYYPRGWELAAAHEGLIPFEQAMTRSESVAAVELALRGDGRTSAIYAEVFGESGVDFYFDEAQLVFDTRNFQRLQEPMMFWLTQHRKLNQHVTVITQSVQNIAPPFVRLCAFLVRCRNFGLQSALGVKLPKRLKATKMTEVQSKRPFVHSTETYKVEKDGLHRWYRTAEGIGMTGAGGGDVGRDNRPGLPFKVGAVLAVVLCLLLISSGFWFVRAGDWLGKKAVERTTVGVAGVVKSNLPPVAVASTNSGVYVFAAGSGAVSARPQLPAEGLWLAGLVVGRRPDGSPLAVYTLSDGRRVNVPSPQVVRADRDYLILNEPWGPQIVRWWTGREAETPYVSAEARAARSQFAGSGVSQGAAVGPRTNQTWRPVQ
jgi:hypothetical protein